MKVKTANTKDKRYSWPVKKEHSDHMLMRQRQRRKRGMTKAETWAHEQLKETGFKWTHEARWGWRMFDFWSAFLGCAIEIDGKEHCKKIDKQKDEKEFKRSAIITIRIKNFNEDDLKLALERISKLECWNCRRVRIGKKALGFRGIKQKTIVEKLPSDYHDLNPLKFI